MIITIGREFGSGGRELGRRLADTLGIAYYDSEIVEEIAKGSNLSRDYVARVMEKRPSPFFPVGHSAAFAASYDPHFQLNNTIYTQQTKILKEMAARSDCVIVGRCADYILRDFHPLRVFVYAGMEHRMARCRARSATDELLKNENLSDRELAAKIARVDKERSRYYRFFTGQVWGDRAYYDLLLNTADLSMDTCLKAVLALC